MSTKKRVYKKSYIRKTESGRRIRVKPHYQRYSNKEIRKVRRLKDKEFVNISKLRRLKDREFSFQGRKYRFETYSDGTNAWIWKPFSKSFKNAPKSTNRFASEVVASQLGKELGLDIVENHFAIKIKKGERQYGTISKFVEDSKNLKEIFLTDKRVTNDIFLFVPFEIWLRSTDRHLSQYIIKNRRAIALDFEESMSPKHPNYQIGHLAVVLGKGVQPLDQKEVKVALQNIKRLQKKEIREIVELPDESKLLSAEEQQALKEKEKELEDFLIKEQGSLDENYQKFITVRKQFQKKKQSKRKNVSEFRKQHFWGSG